MLLLSVVGSIPVEAKVTASAIASPNPAFILDRVALRFEKEVEAADGPQTGSVTLSVEGPEPLTYPPKNYTINPVTGPAEKTMWWHWTPTVPGTYRFTFNDEVTIGKAIDRSLSVTVSGRRGAGFNDGEHFFALGDSITGANALGLPADGSLSYVMQLRDRHYPGLTADHNMDGAGKSTTWGVSKVSLYLPNGRPSYRNTVYFIEFGGKDRRENITEEQTAANLGTIYERVLPIADRAFVLMPPVFQYNETIPWTEFEQQRQWIEVVEAGLVERGVPFFKTYDALDSVPGNDQADPWTPERMIDGVHPDAEGHAALADYIAARL